MTPDAACMAATVEQAVEFLVEKGKESGLVTYQDMNHVLPDETVTPEKIDEVLVALDEMGIDVVDESELATQALGDKDATRESEAAHEQEREKTDDAVRMYLRQMGEIPHSDPRAWDHPEFWLEGLDGSKILYYFLPFSLRQKMIELGRYSWLLFMAILFTPLKLVIFVPIGIVLIILNALLPMDIW